MMGSPASRPLRELNAPSPEIRALLREIAPLASGNASLASRDRLAAARDNWARSLLWTRAGRFGPLPDLVAWPSSIDEVCAITRRAGELGVPLVPMGGGSNGSGATLAVRGGIALDMRRMARVLAVDSQALEVECEAGIVGEALERTLNREGLSLGHHPEDIRSATVGGWLATRSAGISAGRNG